MLVFSITANAESVEVSGYDVDIRIQVTSGGSSVLDTTFSVDPFDDDVQFYDKSVSVGANKEVVHTQTFTVQKSNRTPLIKKGGAVDFSFYNVVMGRTLSIDGGSWSSWNMQSARLLLFYSDGSMVYVDDVDLSYHTIVGGDANDINANFTVPKDVTKIEVIGKMTSNPYATGSYRVMAGEWGNSTFRLSLDQESKSEGLLGGIIDWLKGIKSGITDLFSGITEGFSNLGSGISNVFNSIVELPSKIWSFISDGLKSLFVPDDEFIVSFKDDIDNMLEDKLGAVYQVVNILTESWDSITANDQANVITIPQTTINLPNNNTFSFGGFDVPIVPNGFDFIVSIIKTLVGIVCTILFVNGLRKKYDEVMGVEQ